MPNCPPESCTSLQFSQERRNVPDFFSSSTLATIIYKYLPEQNLVLIWISCLVGRWNFFLIFIHNLYFFLNKMYMHAHCPFSFGTFSLIESKHFLFIKGINIFGQICTKYFFVVHCLPFNFMVFFDKAFTIVIFFNSAKSIYSSCLCLIRKDSPNLKQVSVHSIVSVPF